MNHHHQNQKHYLHLQSVQYLFVHPGMLTAIDKNIVDDDNHVKNNDDAQDDDDDAQDDDDDA